MVVDDFVLHSVLDAWGKVPSAIFSGNLYDLGGFSQCSNIERQGKVYKTQYCIGQVVIESDIVQQQNVSLMLDAKNDSMTTSIYLLPQ